MTLGGGSDDEAMGGTPVMSDADIDGDDDGGGEGSETPIMSDVDLSDDEFE